MHELNLKPCRIAVFLSLSFADLAMHRLCHGPILCNENPRIALNPYVSSEFSDDLGLRFRVEVDGLGKV